MLVRHVERGARAFVCALTFVPAEVLGADTPPPGVGVTVDARRSEAAILLYGKGLTVRRAVARHVKVRWVNDAPPAVERRLSELEGRLTAASGRAKARDVRALRGARADIRRGRVFAQIYRRGGMTLALIEAPARVVRRLRGLPHFATAIGHPEREGCSYSHAKVLPISVHSVASREVFSSRDGCLIAEVYEVVADAPSG